MIAPMFVPALKMPVDNARSFFGNHSATVLILAGKFPDSPSPSEKRATKKLLSELHSAWPIEATLQNHMLRILIDNPADPDRADIRGEGIGIENARGRLSAVSEGRAMLQAREAEGQFRVVIELPR